MLRAESTRVDDIRILLGIFSQMDCDFQVACKAFEYCKELFLIWSGNTLRENVELSIACLSTITSLCIRACPSNRPVLVFLFSYIIYLDKTVDTPDRS